EKCIEAGASDYIPKPVAPDQLLSVLCTWALEDETAEPEAPAAVSARSTSHRPEGPPQMERPPTSPVDILLVDDNPGKMLALDTAHAPLGENLVHAPSGREALRQHLSRDFA